LTISTVTTLLTRTRSSKTRTWN